MIRLKSVYFIRSGKTLLSDINWDVKRGENWVLFGKNGSGKTLLLSIIMGYNSPSKGEIYRFGYSPPGYDLREVRKAFGYIGTPLKNMFDNYSSMTIIDVVLSGYFATIGLYNGVTSRMKKEALALLEGVGMLERAKEPFNHLSDGEKQKVLIMRSVINRPKILVLDEPALGLDLPSREDLLTLIRKLAHKDISIIYTTHHTEEIIDIFGKVLILDSGKIFFKGGVREGLSSENISRLFGTRVEMFTYNQRYFTLIGG